MICCSAAAASSIRGSGDSQSAAAAALLQSISILLQKANSSPSAYSSFGGLSSGSSPFGSSSHSQLGADFRHAAGSANRYYRPNSASASVPASSSSVRGYKQSTVLLATKPTTEAATTPAAHSEQSSASSTNVEHVFSGKPATFNFPSTSQTSSATAGSSVQSVPPAHGEFRGDHGPPRDYGGPGFGARPTGGFRSESTRPFDSPPNQAFREHSDSPPRDFSFGPSSDHGPLQGFFGPPSDFGGSGPAFDAPPQSDFTPSQRHQGSQSAPHRESSGPYTDSQRGPPPSNFGRDRDPSVNNFGPPQSHPNQQHRGPRPPYSDERGTPNSHSYKEPRGSRPSHSNKNKGPRPHHRDRGPRPHNGRRRPHRPQHHHRRPNVNSYNDNDEHKQYKEDREPNQITKVRYNKKGRRNKNYAYDIEDETKENSYIDDAHRWREHSPKRRPHKVHHLDSDSRRRRRRRKYKKRDHNRKKSRSEGHRHPKASGSEHIHVTEEERSTEPEYEEQIPFFKGEKPRSHGKGRRGRKKSHRGRHRRPKSFPHEENEQQSTGEGATNPEPAEEETDPTKEVYSTLPEYLLQTPSTLLHRSLVEASAEARQDVLIMNAFDHRPKRDPRDAQKFVNLNEALLKSFTYATESRRKRSRSSYRHRRKSSRSSRHRRKHKSKSSRRRHKSRKVNIRSYFDEV